MVRYNPAIFGFEIFAVRVDAGTGSCFFLTEVVRTWALLDNSDQIYSYITAIYNIDTRLPFIKWDKKSY